MIAPRRPGGEVEVSSRRPMIAPRRPAIPPARVGPPVAVRGPVRPASVGPPIAAPGLARAASVGSPIKRGMPFVGSFKKGGKVRKTGVYKLHKGENVVPLSALAGKYR